MKVKQSFLEVPAKTSELENDAGFITASDIPSSVYVKPVNGIPASDMESAVQQALTKAGTALQSFTETDPVYTSEKHLLSLKSELNAHNVSNTAHDDIRSELAVTRTIAEGKERAIVFDSLADLDAWLGGAIIPGVDALLEDLQTGDNFYIRDTGVPDFWWDGTQPIESESKNVDLTDYLTKTESDGRYVQQVSGKGLSDENYTLTEKNKLAGINLSNYYDKTSADNTFVAKEAGKGLSEKDFTAAFNTLMTFYAATPLTVTTLTNIPTTAPLVYANLSAAQSLSVSGTPPVGQAVHVCARNTAASAISVSIPTTGSYISKDASVSIPAGGFWEFSIIYDTVVSRYRIINLGLS